MNAQIKSSLIGNAMDYLLLSNEMVHQKSPRMLKHAIANLADGIELLLKSRLELHDWCLLFKDIDRADRQKYASGDFFSVTFDQAIKRLTAICEIEFTKKQIKTLNALRLIRNKVRHASISLSLEEATSILVKTYSFAIDFIDSQLRDASDEEAASNLDELRALLSKYDSFVDERMKEISFELADVNWHVSCPRCLRDALYPNDGDVQCAFCRHSQSPEDATLEWKEQYYGITRMKDWLNIPNIDCPDCGEPAIPADNGCMCFSCGHQSRFNSCLRCHASTFDDVCDYCRHKIEKDE